MAVLTKEDLLKIIQTKLTDSDEDITILENVTDTVNSMQDQENINWKQKFEENDKAWRERYIARFSEPAVKQPVDDKPPLPDQGEPLPKSANVTYDDLFTE